MTNSEFYAGKMEEPEKNVFEIAILDSKDRKRYIFYLRVCYLEDYTEIIIGWKKLGFLKKMNSKTIATAWPFRKSDIDLLKGLLVMIAKYCCLYSKIETDSCIVSLLTFALESVLMDEAKGVLLGK